MIQHEGRQEKGKTQNAEQGEGAAPLSSGTAQTESISGRNNSMNMNTTPPPTSDPKTRRNTKKKAPAGPTATTP